MLAACEIYEQASLDADDVSCDHSWCCLAKAANLLQLCTPLRRLVPKQSAVYNSNNKISSQSLTAYTVPRNKPQQVLPVGG